MTTPIQHRVITLAALAAAGPIIRRSYHRDVHLSRVLSDRAGFVPAVFPEVDLVAEAEARRVRGSAALLHDVLFEDLDEDEEMVPEGFPTPGLGSQNADPVAAAEYIARMHATHEPGGTQNP